MTTANGTIDDLRKWASSCRISKNKFEEFEELLRDLEAAVTPPAPHEFQEYEKSEKRIQKEVRLAAQDLDGMLLRNNSGVAREPDIHGGIRVVRYGLGNASSALNRRFKSSDLIGALPVTVGLQHIGRTFGVFTAVEIKKPGFKFKFGNDRVTGQANFLMSVNNLGGLGLFATCAADLKREFERRF